MTTTVRAAETTASSTGTDRRSGVTVWAATGLLWTVLCLTVILRWVTSGTEFGPAPVLGPDTVPTAKLVALRVFEGLSLAVLFACIWWLVIKPWRARREVGLDAFLVLGGIIGFTVDAMLNLYAYLFAWNAHSVNLGVWAAFMPFHQDGAPSRYAEGLLWGLPMYVYFCAGLGALGLYWVRRLRARRPGISNAAALSVVWLGDFAFDFVVENVIIRTTDAYAFARTEEWLTLWAGSQHQFPIYESVLVACVSVAFTYVRLSAMDSPEGLSMIERGANRFPLRWRLPVRAFAAVGYCAVVLIMLYHLPFNWISLGGDSLADLPSYMLPGDG